MSSEDHRKVFSLNQEFTNEVELCKVEITTKTYEFYLDVIPSRESLHFFIPFKKYSFATYIITKKGKVALLWDQTCEMYYADVAYEDLPTNEEKEIYQIDIGYTNLKKKVKYPKKRRLLREDYDTCPADKDEIGMYCYGETQGEEKELFEAHLRSCLVCQERVGYMNSNRVVHWDYLCNNCKFPNNNWGKVNVTNNIYLHSKGMFDAFSVGKSVQKSAYHEIPILNRTYCFYVELVATPKDINFYLEFKKNKYTFSIKTKNGDQPFYWDTKTNRYMCAIQYGDFLIDREKRIYKIDIKWKRNKKK